MIQKVVLLWCLMACVVLFFLMGADKGRAKKEKRRVAEKTLFAWALLGGALGGWQGMRAFHHKTKHWYFKFGFPILTALEVAGLVAMLMYKA